VWAWCIHTRDDSVDITTPPCLDVVLDCDSNVVGKALATGAIAATELAPLMHLLTQAITVAGIDGQAGKLLMLHAAGIANAANGRALAAIAATGTGKTTFIRTVGPGRTYLTDETVAIRDDLTIVPYPKPLSVLLDGGTVKHQVGPATISASRPSNTYSIAALWILERSVLPVPPHLQPVQMLEAITSMAPQISYLSSLPNPLRRVADTIHAAGGLYRAIYHEAADLESLVDSALMAEP
jgi:hypothetical protein